MKCHYCGKLMRESTELGRTLYRCNKCKFLINLEK